MREQFFFGVPLRARATAQSWDRVCTLLQMCLRSLINQTDGDFRVLLACHNAPEFAEMSDPRVQMIRSKAPVPTTSTEQMYDKGRKVRAIRAAMREHGGGYLMALDADDLVSSKLVSFVRSDLYPYGYLIVDGYEYDCSADRVRVAPRFNRVCGSSAIFYFAPEDLPQHADDVDSLSDKFKSHRAWATTAAELGRPFRKLPFRGAMYLTNSGENWSALTGSIGWRRKLLRMFTPARRVNDALRSEFALDADGELRPNLSG